MATGFNPYAPDALGLEWFFSIEDSVQITDRTPGALSFTATVTEDCDSAFISFARGVDSTGWTLEVYDLTAGVGTTSVSVTKFQPGEDARNVDAFKFVNRSIAGNTNLYQALATDTDGTPVLIDDFISGIFGGGYEYGTRFTGVSGSFVGDRIQSLRLDARVTPEIAYYYVQPGAYTPYLYVNGKRWWGRQQTFWDPQLPDGYELSQTWTADPSTGCPWTVAAVDEFSTGGDSYGGFVVQPTGTSNTIAEIRSIELQVRDVGVEDRVAIGCIPAAGSQWTEVPLVEPVLGGPFEKTSGNDYLVVVRRTADTKAGAQLDWRRLGVTEGFAPGPQDWQVRPVTVLSNTGRPQLPIPTGEGGAFSLVLQRDADGNTSEDGVPWSAFGDDDGATTDPENFWTRVHSENTTTGKEDSFIEQEFTPGANDSYSFIKLLVRLVPGALGALEESSIARLRVAIYDRATDTQQGSTVFVYPTDLTPDRRSFQTVGKYMGNAASLTSGTQYYVRISTAARPDNVGSWAVGVASNFPDGIFGTPPADSGRASYGGTTNAYTLISPSAVTTDEQQGLDAMVTVHTQPTTPAGFSVTATPAPTGLEFPCSPQPLGDIVNYAEIAWTPTSLGSEGGGFAQYEIERDDGEGYVVIGLVTDETCSSIDDHEALPNNSPYPRYRMRVVRMDWSASLWTTETSTPLTMLDHGGFAYTTNFFPDRGVWYGHGDPIEYEWPTAPVDREMYLRDGTVRFQELEDRLTTVVVDVLARFIAQACDRLGLAQGEQVFDPLLYLAQVKQVPTEDYQKLTHPYVCVRSAAGERWFSYLSTPGGEREEPQGVYTMPGVTIRQATRVPAPIDSQCALGSGS